MSFIFSAWLSIKHVIEIALPFSHDALHVHAGLLIFLTALVLIRQPRIAWTLCLGLAAWNEVVDLMAPYNTFAPTDFWLREAGPDLFNTMIWPTIILVIIKCRKDIRH
ncbi:hypothetical protein [Mesorhizobium sp. J428]|uniref:hypothetical protein n=1 Tax=Mesorhizobium sp. J428 TaxID=2898440 RepID=UPI002150814B|nr:hypothetical protein [Mesorhizobium sp. J428]MCR5858285.1 hypothetical protein [Mesorhizobium sp. J428]